MTTVRACSLTLWSPRSTRLAVARETPARAATSSSVGAERTPAGLRGAVVTGAVWHVAPTPVRSFGPRRGPDRADYRAVVSAPASPAGSSGPDFHYSDLLPLGADDTPYRLVTTEGVSTFQAGGRTFLQVEASALRRLTAEAMHDIAHYLRPAHLAQRRRIIDDPESSGNDRFVALDLLKNVNISAGGVLPMCQDTGTAIVMGKKSEGVLTGSDDAVAISRGVYDAYTKLNLRYSQLAPITTWEKKNTGTNLPAQIELYSTPGHTAPEYKFLFMAKGGGSANKSFLFQETKAILNPQRLLTFLDEKIRSLGTAACPPYHLAVVIGGTSAEFAL